MSQFLLYEQQDHIVTLTMNEPERRNPLTGNTAVAEFLAAIDRIHADHSVRAVILTGAGSAFSSGGNVRDMGRYADMPALELRREYRLGIQRLPQALFNLEVPVIAAVNGHAIGAGLDLACMCDIRVAAEEAKFAESFVKLGIIPGDGGAWLLPRIVGFSKASEMALTGDIIDAQEALRFGLVSKVVPADQLMDEAMAIAKKIASNPPHAVRMTKRLLREGSQTGLKNILEASAAFQAICHTTEDHDEAVNAFLEKRTPTFTGK